MPKSKNRKIKDAKKLLQAEKKANKALATLLKDRHCVNCGRELHTKVSAYAASLETGLSSTMDIGYCITCKSDVVQSKKLQKAANHFPMVVNVMHTLQSINTFRFTVELDSSIMKMLGLPSKYTIRYGVVDASASDLSVEGCHYFNDMKALAKRFPSRMVEFTGDVDFTIIIFKLANNRTRFAALGAMDIASRILVEEAKSRCLEFNNSGHRSGSSTGFVFSDTNSHSRTPVTHKDTTEFVASPIGVNSTVIYDNTGALRPGKKPPGSIIARGIYNDKSCMDRMTSTQKAKRVLKLSSYRTTLIAEMKSRVSFLGIAHELGLLSQDPFAKLTSFSERFPKAPAETILLEYACSTGEMANYSALPAHDDGNKSHEVETLAYKGRVANNANLQNTDDIVNNCSPAFLYCCNAGVLFKIAVGRTIMHCNLNKIMHAADTSRNDANYSRASGPCGPHLDNIKFK